MLLRRVYKRLEHHRSHSSFFTEKADTLIEIYRVIGDILGARQRRGYLVKTRAQTLEIKLVFCGKVVVNQAFGNPRGAYAVDIRLLIAVCAELGDAHVDDFLPCELGFLFLFHFITSFIDLQVYYITFRLESQ